MVLEKIEKENDIKKVEPCDWNLLAQEIREFLIEKLRSEERRVGKECP